MPKKYAPHSTTVNGIRFEPYDSPTVKAKNLIPTVNINFKTGYISFSEAALTHKHTTYNAAKMYYSTEANAILIRFTPVLGVRREFKLQTKDNRKFIKVGDFFNTCMKTGIDKTYKLGVEFPESDPNPIMIKITSNNVIESQKSKPVKEEVVETPMRELSYDEYKKG